MKKIGFSGTLDPITNGHMWVIREARAMAHEVIVFISENPGKKARFTAEKRKQIIEASIAEQGLDNISVMLIKSDYTARAAKNYGVEYLLRGIRNTADFDYENLLQQTNVDVLDGAKTLFVMPPRDLGAVSSSFVKALQGPVGWHWKIRQFLPTPAYRAMLLDWLAAEWAGLWPASVDADQAAKRQHWFDYLTGEKAYGGVTRHHHSLEHLVHGLDEISGWANNSNAAAADVAVVKKAYWFHDAVYGQTLKTVSDEEASARLWLESGLDADNAEAVAALIRATDHFQENAITHPLKHILLGADLAILGQAPAIYAAYAAGIRAEHPYIPAPLFIGNRRKAMVRLCQQARDDRLFGDPYFAARYNAAAIANMAREIQELS